MKVVDVDDNMLRSPEDILENMRANQEVSEEQYQEIMFRFEDISDSLQLNKYQIYKKAFENNRMDKCIEVLLDLGAEEPYNFKKGLLLSNALKNPMGFNFNDYELKKILFVLFETLKKAKVQEYPKDFISALIEIILYYRVFYFNNQNNTKKLNENKFCDYSLSKQLRLICIFIQDQSRLMKKQLLLDNGKQSFVTGMEMNVANKSVDYAPKQKISFADNYEGLLENFDTLMKYLYVVKKNDLKKDDIASHGDIHPFKLPEFEEIMYIALQRTMYVKLEEKFRFSGWKLQLVKNQEGQDVYALSPRNINKFRSHIVASIRREYQFKVNITKHIDINKLEEGMSSIESLAKKINLDAVEQFHMDSDLFRKASSIVESGISVYKLLSKKYYFQCRFKEMTVNDVILVYAFLFTYSQIYITAVLNNFNEKEYSFYKYLVPVINIAYLIDEFSNLYQMQRDKSKRLLQCFVYDESVKTNGGDIFSKPLIKVNNKQILLCESLIEQMNLERCVEKVLQEYEVNLKPVGKEFEKKLINKLKEIGTIQVNTNHISFKAYDGDDVEFDFLGTLEDNLLLFEFKSVLIPYDDVEIYKREQMIKEGAEQVQRRCDVIKHDWDMIRKRVNIELPEDLYSEDKIIKVVCTNIYDFTTLKIEGVWITDESTLLKYFTDPIVGVYSKGKDVSKILDAELIWKIGRPTVKEFIEYLDKPVTVGNIPDCLDNEYKIVPQLEEDYLISFMDVTQTKDPFKEAINKKKQAIRGDKVARNDPCPCGSGKKYKKCCGK